MITDLEILKLTSLELRHLQGALLQLKFSMKLLKFFMVLLIYWFPMIFFFSGLIHGVPR